MAHILIRLQARGNRRQSQHARRKTTRENSTIVLVCFLYDFDTLCSPKENNLGETKTKRDREVYFDTARRVALSVFYHITAQSRRDKIRKNNHRS